LQGNERHEDLDYPDREWRYFVLAEKFGWTPQQVDEQPAALLDWLIAIAGVKSEVEAEKINVK
jgi:hypothetical protein